MTPTLREMISFRLGEGEFCVDIMSVREIRGWTPATPVPQAPRFIRGVINLRGAVLPILDLADRLGFAPSEPSTRHVIVVAQMGGETVGLLVDAVSEILTVTPEMIQETPEIASAAAAPRVGGVLVLDGRMISLLSLDDAERAPTRQAA